MVVSESGSLERLVQVVQAHLLGNLDAILVLEAAECRIAAILDQYVDDLDLVGAQRQVHRRVHVVILRIDHGAILQQLNDDFAVARLKNERTT